MSFRLTPLNLMTIFVLSTCSIHSFAQTEQEECDTQAVEKILHADEVEAFNKLEVICGQSLTDSRGFTIYDRARLAGSGEIIASLRKKRGYDEASYSTAMGKLVQTGLRFLNFDAGIIDGELGEHSSAAIKRYQKQYGFSGDGKLHSNWLADFYRRLVKKTQQELTDLGFDAGGVDGIIGPKTITAMQAFRQEWQLPVADYREVDDQLLYQLMILSHEKNKKALAKRDAERAARRAAQEAARRKAVARAREEAQRKAEAKRQAAEAAAIAARQQREAEERRIKLLQMKAENNQMLERLTAPQGGQEPAAQAQTEQARIAQEKAAAERAAAEQKAREERARQAALAAKAAEEKAERKAEASARAADQANREALSALKAAKNNQPVQLSEEMQQATAVQGAETVGRGFSELKGVLQFSSPSSCTVAGQPIESSWCESYLPSDNGKQCSVVMSNSGTVVSFLCE